jgi:L-iditol 2-dehydrogenase
VVPESTRAVVLHAYGGPLTVEEVPVPQEIEANALLVKTRAATLCGSDVHIWQGQMAAVLGADLPIILGHEMTGEIVAFGPGHRRDSLGQSLIVGDRIVWTQSSCYSCYACTMLRSPAKCENRQYYGLSNCTRYPNLLGGLAQHCYVLPGSGRVRVPDAIPDHWASGSSCALRTVVSSFERLTLPLDGFQTVVIQGAGPLGLFATALARWMGVERVITIGAPEARLDVATAWGAERTLLIDETSTPESRVNAVLELTGGQLIRGDQAGDLPLGQGRLEPRRSRAWGVARLAGQQDLLPPFPLDQVRLHGLHLSRPGEIEQRLDGAEAGELL